MIYFGVEECSDSTEKALWHGLFSLCGGEYEC